MRSSNPVFARSEGFNGRGTTSGVSYPAYSDPSTWHQGSNQPPTTVDQGRMTIDTVVQKTGMTLGLLVVSAALTWVLTGNPTEDPEAASQLAMLWMGGAFVGLGLALVISFKRVVSPGMVLAYAVVEGVFVGAMSKYFQAAFGEGVVSGAVLGTVVAFAATLAAYKFFNIQVTSKFRKWVVAAMFGFVAVSLLDFVLSFFGADFGFRNYGMMGLITSLIGLGLGVLLLILDFNFVERGVAAGLPERESWRAAFGLTVTIIWIYIELLRILAILRGND